MRDRKILLIPIFLAAQAMLAQWAGTGELRPAPPDFSKLPVRFGEWMRSAEIPSDVVASQLGADRVMEWVYGNASTNRSADLFVAWFQSQRSGAVQPHSPLFCLPGNGWAVESSGRVSLATPGGPLRASRIVTSKGVEHAVVLYWYQLPFRAVADEWESKLWMAVDVFREKRTDIALVRVVVTGSDDRATNDLAASFAGAVYPLVRERLPK